MAQIARQWLPSSFSVETKASSRGRNDSPDNAAPKGREKQGQRSVSAENSLIGRRPWVVAVVVGFVSMAAIAGISIVHVRLAQAAFDFDQEQRRSQYLQDIHEEKRLEVAVLESPERIDRAAAELGMVIPENEAVVLVDVSGLLSEEAGATGAAGQDAHETGNSMAKTTADVAR